MRADSQACATWICCPGDSQRGRARQTVVALQQVEVQDSQRAVPREVVSVVVLRLLADPAIAQLYDEEVGHVILSPSLHSSINSTKNRHTC